MRAPSAKPWAPWAPLASEVSQVQLQGNGRQGIPTLQLSCGRTCRPEALTGLWRVRRPRSQSGGMWGHFDPCSGTTVGSGRAPWVTPDLQGDSGAPITPTHVASPAPHPGSKQTPTASGGSSLLGGEDCHMRRSITVWGGGAISHFSPAFQDGGGPGHRVKSRESRFPPLPKFQKKQRPFISFSLSVVPYNITFNKDGYNGR